jgi:hypothetical protein
MSSPVTNQSGASAAPSARCATCGSPVVGKFCANCGAAAGSARCAGCQAELSAGAHFCHRCGTPAGGVPSDRLPVASTASVALPWTVAAIAMVALVASFAGQRFNAPRGAGLDAPSNALPQAGLDFPQGGGPMGGAAAGGLASAAPAGDAAAAPFAAGGPNEVARRAPDISQMTPEERAARLYNRVMTYVERSAQAPAPAVAKANQDSAQMFSVMAGMAYQQLPSLNLDQRYDLARIAQVGGDAALAKAQADTILRKSPTHLLGLALATSLAGDAGNVAEMKSLDARLLAAEAAERKRGLPEYTAHSAEVDSAVARARRRSGGR